MMKLSDLFAGLETEFDLDIPEEVEDKMVCVRDVRDYIVEAYRMQGTQLPSALIFERVRRVIAGLTDLDTKNIQPQTKLADLMPDSDSLIWS